MFFRTVAVYPKLPALHKSLKLFCIFMLLFSMALQSQAEDNIVLYHNTFDRITGLQNLPIHYGKVYTETHQMTGDKTKFFPSSTFVSGTAVFNGKPYYSLNLTYNVYEDALLMKVDNQFGGKIMVVQQDKTEAFTLKDSNFIRLDDPNEDKNVSAGFYEVSLHNWFFSLLIKHQKKLNLKVIGKRVIHEFEDLPKICILSYKNKYYPIQGFRDLQSLFPEYREELRALKSKNGKDAPFDKQLKAQLEFLSSLILKTNSR